ncbi:MAG TPA: tRNA epoxyqueuosine(34) reductase QueG [Polyangiaceae bacterium]|nr:tRNA epoxyqueuosine(34) reductase QueG [Polyangiaceae bacterium]
MSAANPSNQSPMLGIEHFEPDGAPLSADQRTPRGLSLAIEREGRALGFSRIGITNAEPLELAQQRLEQFRSRGYAGAMDYLRDGERHDPRALLPEAESVVVGLFAHGDPDVVPLRAHRSDLSGQIARYAQGEDYHLVVKARLLELGKKIATLAGRTVRGRACVDTAPLLERELAARAGLGFQGKSTLLIAPGVGSYVLLGELLIDLPLAPTEGSPAGCGSCRACLDACPTSAFPEPYRLDARRCISYLTIEHEGPIPRELRAHMGKRVFGCDVCQETCPFNASPSRPTGSALGRRDALTEPDLVALLELGSAGYRKLVRRSALRRVSRATLQRNAAIALGNSGSAEAVAPLTRALRENAEPLVRAHAAWALGRLLVHLDARALSALGESARGDADVLVREEAQASLELAQGSSGGGSSAR